MTKMLCLSRHGKTPVQVVVRRVRALLDSGSLTIPTRRFNNLALNSISLKSLLRSAAKDVYLRDESVAATDYFIACAAALIARRTRSRTLIELCSSARMLRREAA